LAGRRSSFGIREDDDGDSEGIEEIVDFIAAGTNPASVIAFRPSTAVKARVAYLIDREKTTGLSPDEKSELDHYSPNP